MRLLRSLCREEKGASALEFAVVGPVLAIVALGIIDGWSFASHKLDMNVAVKAAANYYYQGGTSDSSARDIALAAWPNPPDDADVAVSRACSCGDSVVSCSTLCSPNLSTPSTTITIEASSTWIAPFSAEPLPTEQPLSGKAIIRVR
jgi:Flp pilus assembly pilin Flp